MPLPTDTLFGQQWHLSNPNAGLLDLNVTGVWNAAQGASYTGAGVTVVVIDDGFDYNHSDLVVNYDETLDYDFENNSLDPFGLPTDGHGTAVSGIIAADNNGTGVVGIAFDSTLIGYRTEGFITDAWLATIAEAITAGAQSALGDVINISQGIANDEFSEFGFGYAASRFDDIETSIGTAVNEGRGGLGSIIVKSAGNSRRDFYDVNSDDWTNDTRQVVVAAVNQDGSVSNYSSYGAALLVSGFGTPGEVVTTDRSGAEGYNATDIMPGFNGTSSAAPMVSGVVALMLEANPNLGWRDVQTILANSARHVGSAVGGPAAGFELFGWGWNAADTWNGGGLHFSNDYGYGLVDALAAVRMAETWLVGGESAQTTPNQYTNTIDLLDTSTTIPDGNFTGTLFNGSAEFDDVVERVTVQVTFATTYMEDVSIEVISPNGTISILTSGQAGSLVFDGTWTFETQAFRGERAAGNWGVRIVDSFTGDVLTVSDIVLKTYGAATDNDRYVYTNEYSDYAGIGGHTVNVTDTNGGTDTVNASAVSTASIIWLDSPSGLVSQIDGIVTTFSGIENAIGGDGDDFIIGSAGANQLFGMRGNDTIVGDDGNDTLDGGAGEDEMTGGLNDDTYFVDNANDKTIEQVNQGFDIVFSSVNFNLAGTFIDRLELTGTNAISATGNSQANTLIGNEAANTLTGLGGRDTLDGKGGADTMLGGAGDDTYHVDNVSDRTTELANEGFDTVNSSVSFSLGGTFIERLVLTGDDAISATGNSQVNTLVGNAANNTLNGLGNADTMSGSLGDDIYFVDHVGDKVIERANEGFDTINSAISFNLAGIFAERLVLTGSGATSGTGNGQANTLIGNGGANILNALGGADVLDGGLGTDTLTGGTGPDTFAFTSVLGVGNIDTISDFSVVDDTIQLASSIFTGLAGGRLDLGAFVIGANAVDASDRIIYDSATGALLFDSDGSGLNSAIQFASLATNLALTNADFIVV